MLSSNPTGLEIDPDMTCAVNGWNEINVCVEAKTYSPGISLLALTLKKYRGLFQLHLFCLDDTSFTFGIQLTLQVHQSSTYMEIWLLQFQASQQCLTNILKHQCCNHGSKT